MKSISRKLEAHEPKWKARCGVVVVEDGEFVAFDHDRIYVLKEKDFGSKIPSYNEIFEISGRGGDDMGLGVNWSVYSIKETAKEKSIFNGGICELKTPEYFSPPPQYTGIMSCKEANRD